MLEERLLTNLNPRAARVPETRERTPGSFCTRQLRTLRVNGWVDGGGAVLEEE